MIVNQPTLSFYALLLAAGESVRFGATKQLADIGDKTMLDHAVSQLLLTDISELKILLGANADRVKSVTGSYHASRHANSATVTYLTNANWQIGMGSSIALGVESLPASATHVMICLGDQIALTSSDYDALIQKAKAFPEKIICAHYANVSGVPAIFPRSYFTDLQQLKRDKGARDIIQQAIPEVKTVMMPRASIDIDTPEDLTAWLRE